MSKLTVNPLASEGGQGADIRTYPVAAGQSIKQFDVVDVVDGKVTAHQRQLKAVPVGTTVQLFEYGNPIDYIVAQHNYQSPLNGMGRTLLVRMVSPGNSKWSGGTNRYAGSEIDNAAMTSLRSYSTEMQALIWTTKIPHTIGGGDATLSTISRAVFVLSLTELGGAHVNVNTEGSGIAVNLSSKLQWTRSPLKTQSGDAARLSNAGVTEIIGVETSLPYFPAVTLPGSMTFGISEEASQAISLQDGTGGQSVQCIFDGTTELPGLAAGQEITSPGVRGYCPEDGVLWVQPEWAGGIVSGIFSVDKNSTTEKIIVGFRPKLVIIFSGANFGAVGGMASQADINSVPRILTEDSGGLTSDGFTHTVRYAYSNIRYVAFR